MDASPPRQIELADFEPLVGQVFEADCNPKTAALRLIEASPLGSAAATASGPFILVFHSAPDVYLVDGIYKVQAKGCPVSEIAIGSMIAPRDAQPGYYYQAVFN